jgi:uncharacterized membrane protein YphA (DoxX/SURF4 family)
MVMSKSLKIGALVARVLLGLPFVVFGLNGILHFMPVPPMAGPAGAFAGALAAAGYFLPMMGFFQALGGLLVLTGRLLPLGLILLAPILVNIDAFHLGFGEPAGAGLVVFLNVLELSLAWLYRGSFGPLFNARLAA